MEQGDIVEAQFNGAWYPCVIESKTGDDLSVEFLGYKNKETVNLLKARLISQTPSLNPESITEGEHVFLQNRYYYFQRRSICFIC